MNINKEKNFISAVVYAFNASNNIKAFLQLLNDALSDKFEHFEIICVNDCSTDNTVERIKEYSATSNSIITILNMSYHQGMELSLNAGVDIAIGDFVYEFEMCLEPYMKNQIIEVYEKAMEGFDIVATVSLNARDKVSKMFYSIYNKYANTHYHLQTELFRIVSRRAINRVDIMTKTIPYRKAVYANCGLKKSTIVCDLECNIPKRDILQKSDYRNTAVTALVLYTDLAFRWSIRLSAIMMMIMFGVGIYTIVIYLQGIPIAGWSSTILFLAFTFFALFALLTAIIKYLSIVLQLSFNRLNYVIESIEKLK